MTDATAPRRPRRPRRQNIYFPDHMIDYLDGEDSLSGRVVQIIDRYREALRRTRVHTQFSDSDLLIIRRSCLGWWAEPAATIFGGIAMEVEDSGGPAELVDRLNALSPWEQVALLEYVQRRSE